MVLRLVLKLAISTSSSRVHKRMESVSSTILSAGLGSPRSRAVRCTALCLQRYPHESTHLPGASQRLATARRGRASSRSPNGWRNRADGHRRRCPLGDKRSSGTGRDARPTGTGLGGGRSRAGRRGGQLDRAGAESRSRLGRHLVARPVGRDWRALRFRSRRTSGAVVKLGKVAGKGRSPFRSKGD